jgi:hypothetical protein
MSIYFHFSEATDVTGPVLRDRINALENRTARGEIQVPNFNGRGRNQINIYVGWGCKVRQQDDFNMPNRVVVLNSPQAVRSNRNKLTALGTLSGAGVPVAGYLAAERPRRREAVTNMDALHEMGYPLIGRTKYHQGGKGFWTILNRPMLEQAMNDGCAYVQQVISTQDEYRVHVFDGNVIYLVKKVPQENPKNAWIATVREKVLARAAGGGGRNEVQLDDTTLAFALDYLGDAHEKPNMIIKSNTRGWKFSRIRNAENNRELREVAVNAINALGLQFGAVDMAIDTAGNVFVIEVNSAPGLERRTLDAWVNAFQGKFTELEMGRQQVPADNRVAAQAAAAAAPLGGDRGWLQDLAEGMTEREATGLRALLERLRE